MKAGLGTTAVALGPVKVGAVVSVNACGNVVDPFTGEWVAGMRATADSDLDRRHGTRSLTAAGSMQMPLEPHQHHHQLHRHQHGAHLRPVPPRSPNRPQTLTHTPSVHAHHQRRRHHLHPRQRQTGRRASAAVPLDLTGHARRKRGFANRHRKRSQTGPKPPTASPALKWAWLVRLPVGLVMFVAYSPAARRAQAFGPCGTRDNITKTSTGNLPTKIFFSLCPCVLRV